MKEYSEAEIKNKAEVYCSSVERCPSDVEEKIRKWGASEEVTERIMAHLQKERYLDAQNGLWPICRKNVIWMRLVSAGFMCGISTVSISGGG